MTAIDNGAARRAADFLRARETMGADWGTVLEEVRVGYARLTATVSERLLNGYGSAHGGALFTLADTAFAYACNSHGLQTVAQGATISFLGPARPYDRLVIEAQEIMSSGRSGAYAVSVRTDDGRPIASFHGLSRTVGGAILTPETEHD